MFKAFPTSQKLRSFAVACTIGFVASAAADEGMWLFNAPPSNLLKEKYHFEPTRQWLDQIALDGETPPSVRARAEALQALLPPVAKS